MTITADLAAKGVVLRAGAGTLVFNPLNSNYELQLEAGDASLAAGSNVHGVIHVRARKIYTVPSGGGFIVPVLGTPRIIQGRIVTLDDASIVVRAGNALFAVALPSGKDAIDLANGDLGANALVNVVVLPGARFERV